MPEYFIGIDPGNEGGLACIIRDGGKLSVEIVMPMPTLNIGDDRKKNIVMDASAVRSFIASNSHCIVAIEGQQAFPEQGIAGTAKHMRAFGTIEGICIGMLAPYRVVKPQHWQKILQGTEGTGKARTIKFVQSMFPALNLTPGKKRKAHDGMADAVAIAVWLSS